MSRQAEAEAEGEGEGEGEALNPRTLAHSPNEREPVTSNSAADIQKKTIDGRSSLVENLYCRYPRKVGRLGALKAIARAISLISSRGSTSLARDEGAAADWLGGRIDLYAQSAQGKQQDKSKIPHPATWFNDGRYDDDESEWQYVYSGKSLPVRKPEIVDGSEDRGFSEILSRPAPEWAKQVPNE